jgi:hypothetical protein
MSKLIGICGFARSGKDSVGTMLCKRDFVRYAFANPLKEACAKMFGIHLSDFHNDKKEIVNEFWGFSPRQMAQLLGTEGGRELFRQDIWIKRAEFEWFKVQRHIDHYNQDTFGDKMNGMVITDVRFENEADFIRDNDGTLIHVKRPGADGVVGVNKHKSENGVMINPDDIVINNNGTLEDLETIVDELIVGGHL